MHERRARVRRVLAAAARLVDPHDPLGREARERLPKATGLSPQGVALGLSEHVETTASDEELDRLLAWAGEAPRVHVVLSANVFVAAVRAIALAVAAAPEVLVKPSRREPIVAALLARALCEAGGPRGGTRGRGGQRIEIVESLVARDGDHVHAYGSDASLRAIRAALPPGVRLRAHGTGFGVAVIDAGSDPERAADELAADVVPFDQRGCLSPRIALVAARGDPLRLAAALGTALARRGERVPRGALDADERTAAAMWRDTLAMTGELFEGESYAVGFDPAPRALTLPPTGRHVHVAVVDPLRVEALLAPLAGAITTVGRAIDGPLARAVGSLAPRARAAVLGRMQKPPLDGPVDRREDAR